MFSNSRMSNLSIHDLMLMIPEFRLHTHLQTYVPPFLLCIGTVGNVLSFCVLMRRSMRVTSTYNYLAVLALVDTLVLYVGLLRKWLAHLDVYDITAHSDWSCKLINMIVYTLTVSSVWLLIAVTVDRYIATVHGIHAQTMCTRRRAARVITAILIFFTLFHSHFLWTMELTKSTYTDSFHCRSAANFVFFVEKVWPWIDGFLYCFAPFAIILILNTMIIVQVIRSRRHRRNITRTFMTGEATPLATPRYAENSFRVTVMLLLISFTFLFCTLPMAVVMIVRAFLSYENITLQQIASYRLASTISELLLYTNHSINFYLYLLSGHRFRQEMCSMVRCCCCRKPPHLPKLYYSTTCRKNSDITTTMVTIHIDSGEHTM